MVTPAQNTSNELPFKFGECLWVTDPMFEEVFDKMFESVFDRSFFVHNGPPQSFMSAVPRIVQFLSTPSGSTGQRAGHERQRKKQQSKTQILPAAIHDHWVLF